MLAIKTPDHTANQEQSLSATARTGLVLRDGAKSQQRSVVELSANWTSGIANDFGIDGLTELRECSSEMAHLVIRHITGIATKYEYRDALDRVERLRDWYEVDPEGGDVELPDIERCVPESLKRRPFGRRILAGMVPEIDNLVARRLLELALEMDRVSRRHTRPEIDDASSELLIDCGEPVPALLAVFEEHDAIEGCFDEDCQTMLEVTPTPNVIIPFNGKTKESVLNAFAILATVCETLSLASRLITLMPGNERMNETGANV